MSLYVGLNGSILAIARIRPRAHQTPLASRRGAYGPLWTRSLCHVALRFISTHRIPFDPHDASGVLKRKTCSKTASTSVRVHLTCVTINMAPQKVLLMSKRFLMNRSFDEAVPFPLSSPIYASDFLCPAKCDVFYVIECQGLDARFPFLPSLCRHKSNTVRV